MLNLNHVLAGLKTNEHSLLEVVNLDLTVEAAERSINCRVVVFVV